MTYGALVIQLIKDFKDIDVVNAELHKMYVPTSSLSLLLVLFSLQCFSYLWSSSHSLPFLNTFVSFTSYRGHNIGVRMVEELLVKANINSCENFRETATVVAKIGFKMFLGRYCSHFESIIIRHRPLTR